MPRFLAHKSFRILLALLLKISYQAAMSGPSNTLLIEGTFEELADELAHYLDDVLKKQSDSGSLVQSEIAPLLEQGQKDEALKKLVAASTTLHQAPEKGAPKTTHCETESADQTPQNSSPLIICSFTSSVSLPHCLMSSPEYVRIFQNPSHHPQITVAVLPCQS